MGFDLTTFIYEVINFLVLIFLLQRLIYRPLRKSIDARRAEIEARDKKATEQVEEAHAMQREVEARKKAIEDERLEAIRAATEEGAEERARLLEQARDDAAAERGRAQRLIEAEREAAVAWAKDVAVEQSVELAGRLLMELAPKAIERALVDLLIREIESNAEAIRAEEGKRAQGEVAPEIEVKFAKIPDESEISDLRAAIAKVLGQTPRLHLREDESLVAGASVRFGYRTLDATVGGQLQALRDRAREILAEEAHVG